jgi:hypothetical protein
MDRYHWPLSKVPCASTAACKPPPHGSDFILVLLSFNGAAQQVDTASLEALVIRMPTQVGWPEISHPAAPERERPVRVSPEKGPHVEVLHSVLSVDEVLGTTLTEGQEKKPPAINAAALGPTRE